MAKLSISTKRPSTEKPESQVKLADIAPADEWERINFKVKKETAFKLRKYAFDNDKSMTEVITSLINTLDNR